MDSTQANRGPVATFRDSSSGAAKIFDFWSPTSPKILQRCQQDVKSMLKVCKIDETSLGKIFLLR